MAEERLQKILANSGVASRRKAEELIVAGRVSVNGRTVVELGSKADLAKDEVKVDGQRLQASTHHVYFAFHKPRNVITTVSDPERRETVMSYFKGLRERIYPVGRLDYASEGLLLLTNDGGLARKLELPATGWIRRYRVRVHGVPDQQKLASLAKGLTIDGERYGPIDAGLDSRKGDNAWLTVSLHEGRNREIRRVMAHLGLAVTRLIRIAYGPFQLGTLARGAVNEVPARVLRDQLPREGQAVQPRNQ
jgi:23S rRNA pseudouridine2605 synthase